ncbi:MAG: hypothetical protein MR383_01280 [Lachnospiraceae bacterium]|nr:hypothetical protein [Lachnospiraceae bacterium]MDD7026089.1 hypothetical protein [Lachnospiraceae bacterium]MDY5701261.1 hypothetical protein [Lachnospiraceae bacterium]
MRNLSNLLAVFALVAMMGLLVGCGCGTTNTPAEDDMVGNTNEGVTPPANSTVEEPFSQNNAEHITNTDNPNEPIVDQQGNLIDENAVNNTNNANNNNTDNINNNTNNNNAVNDAANTTGNVVDDAGNVVGDVIEDAGDAVRDVGRGVNNMTNDVAR